MPAASRPRRPFAHVLLATACAIAAPAVAASCDFSAVDQRFDTLLSDAGLAGGSVLIGNRAGFLHIAHFGNHGPDTVVAVASATKLLSAVRVVQLVERGVLSLDAPVSATLPAFTGSKGTMTLRQMFSHTSGYGDDETSFVLATGRPSLAAAVDAVACCVAMPNGWTPGAQFAYGGIGMHVGGRVVEVATRTDWEAGWQAAIGEPLGITTIDWQGLGPTTNYRIGGGARSSLRDYGRVLQMLAADGFGNGRRLLGPTALALLFADQVAGLPIGYAPELAFEPLRYGLGNWIEPSSASLDAPTVSSLGAFGFYPWIDTARGLYGVFMIRGAAGVNALALPAYQDMLASARVITDADACALIERPPRVFVDGFEPAFD